MVYGFTVEHRDEFHRPARSEVSPAIDWPAGWKVYLPHQCDEWMIAGEKYGHAAQQDEAIKLLQEFIAEAQLALKALEAGREMKPPLD